MKRVLLICITLILMFLNSCNTYNVQDSETQDFEDFYNPQITESIYFERLSDTKHSIYISENDSAELVNRKYIVEDVLIFRYAYDDGFLVYHWNKLNPLNESTKNVRILNSVEYEITEDLFTVFDVSNNKYFDFKTQAEMLGFCSENSIELNWNFSNDFSYETIVKTQGNTIWSIKKSTSESLPGFVVKDNEVIYEGYLSDIYSDNKNILAFKLEIPSKNVLEFTDLNYKELSVSFDEVVKQRRELLFLTEDIYYSKYIIIDLIKGTITEYGDSTEFKNAMDDFGILY